MYNPYQMPLFQNNFNQMQQNILPQQNIMQSNGKPTFDTYRMAPNSSMLIADTSEPIVWRCTSDGLGNVSMEPFDISPHKEKQTLDNESLLTIITEINNRVTKLEENYGNQSTASRKPNKQHDANDETVQK